MHFTNGFNHSILRAPIETNEAHSWQKFESSDQEFPLMPNVRFSRFDSAFLDYRTQGVLFALSRKSCLSRKNVSLLHCAATLIKRRFR